MPDEPTPRLPPPPVKPEPDECCGGGCSPCVLDLYEQALQEWKETVERLKKTPPVDSGQGAE
jgi:hypothetical protein